MSRRRRRGKRRRTSTGLVLLVGLLGSAWWVYRIENSPAKLDASLLLAPQTAAVGQPEAESATLPSSPP
ncbi:MAG: hypothetical protein AAB363_01935, partial [Planctomycetota bacterium]